MNFLGKWMEVEIITLSETTQSQKKTHNMHSMISGYYPQSWEYLYLIQDHINLKEKGDHSLYISFLLRKGIHSHKKKYRTKSG